MRLITAVFLGFLGSSIDTNAAEVAGTVGVAVAITHGAAMHGDLKYPAGFSHFEYVNPEAPKGLSLIHS